mgnify:FL=1
MRPPAPTQVDAPLHLEFDDNTLLPMLFGEHDRHLVRLEQKLGVSLVSRGNRVAISGPHSAAERARDALVFLYDRLRRGLTVDMGDVDGAVRLSGDDGSGGNDLFGSEALAIRTRKRHIAPRTPNQVAYMKTLRDQELVFGLGPAGTGKIGRAYV